MRRGRGRGVAPAAPGRPRSRGRGLRGRLCGGLPRRAPGSRDQRLGQVFEELVVDARRDGRPGLDLREVEGGLEALAGDVGAGVGAADLLVGLEVAGCVARLGEEGGRELEERGWQVGVQTWQDGSECLLD